MVKFMDGSTQLGSAPLSSGSASLSTSLLTAGKHSLSAVYTSATNSQNLTNYTSSSSAILHQTVAKAPLTITAPSPTIPYGPKIPAISPLYIGLQNRQSAPARRPKEEE